MSKPLNSSLTVETELQRSKSASALEESPSGQGQPISSASITELSPTANGAPSSSSRLNPLYTRVSRSPSLSARSAPGAAAATTAAAAGPAAGSASTNAAGARSSINGPLPKSDSRSQSVGRPTSASRSSSRQGIGSRQGSSRLRSSSIVAANSPSGFGALANGTGEEGSPGAGGDRPGSAGKDRPGSAEGERKGAARDRFRSGSIAAMAAGRLRQGSIIAQMRDGSPTREGTDGPQLVRKVFNSASSYLIGAMKSVVVLEGVADPTTITTLSLVDSNLDACPVMEGYISLTELDLSNNRIPSLHQSLFKLNTLTSLKMRKNELGELPTAIGRLTSLQHIDVCENRIQNLPSALGWLLDLQSLRLRSNMFAALPPELSKCSKLKLLEAGGNTQLMSVPTFVLRNALAMDFLEETLPLETMEGFRASHKRLNDNLTREKNKTLNLETTLKAQREEQKELQKKHEELTEQYNDRLAALKRAEEAFAKLLDQMRPPDSNGSEDALQSAAALSSNITNLQAALAAERARGKDLSSHIEELERQMKHAARVAALQAEEGAPAPTGQVTLVFTDIQGSTAQWEANADVMAAGLKQHNALMRRYIKTMRGFEVKTEGDAFMIAFASPLEAVRFCLTVQLALMEEDWGDALLANPDSAIVKDEAGNPIFRGMRVRMGIHTGEPSCERDPTTRRMDYFGPMVNRAARVEGICNGGQITVSGSCMKFLEKHMKELKEDAVFEFLGPVTLKGLDTPEDIWQMLPKELATRAFPPIKGAHSVADSVTQQFEALKEKNAALVEKLHTMESFVSGVRSQADTLASHLRIIGGGGGNNKSAVELVEAMERMEGIFTQIQNIQKDIEEDKKKSKALTEEVSATESTALKSLRDENQRLSSELATKNGQIDRLKESLAEQRKREVAAEAKTSAVRRELLDMTIDRDKWSAEVGKLVDRLREQSEKMSGMMRQFTEASTTAATATQTQKKLAEEAAAAKREAEQMTKQLDFANKNLKAQQARADQLEYRLNEITRSMEPAQQRLENEVRRLMEDLRKTKESSETEIERLKAEVATRGQQIVDQRNQLRESYETNRVLQLQQSSAATEAALWKEKHDQVMAEYNRVSVLGEQAENLRAKLEGERSNLSDALDHTRKAVRAAILEREEKRAMLEGASSEARALADRLQKTMDERDKWLEACERAQAQLVEAHEKLRAEAARASENAREAEKARLDLVAHEALSPFLPLLCGLSGAGALELRVRQGARQGGRLRQARPHLRAQDGPHVRLQGAHAPALRPRPRRHEPVQRADDDRGAVPHRRRAHAHGRPAGLLQRARRDARAGGAARGRARGRREAREAGPDSLDPGRRRAGPQGAGALPLARRLPVRQEARRPAALHGVAPA